MKKVGVFLPGRLGSQRLPNKLILPMGDTCLWEIACKKLSKISDDFEKCVLVSKDDGQLVSIAKYYNLKIIFRSPETSLKDNPLNFVFKDIEQMESKIVMFLNPCLAFLPVEKIEQVLKEVPHKFPYVESAKIFTSWLYNETGLATELDLTKMNTKFVNGMYEPAHAFRVFRKKEFLEDGIMSVKNPILFVLEDKDCIDVDTREDYEYAKWRYENGKK